MENNFTKQAFGEKEETKKTSRYITDMLSSRKTGYILF